MTDLLLFVNFRNVHDCESIENTIVSCSPLVKWS